MSRILLQWETWVYGLFAAIIGGGAGAIGTGFAQVITDPQHADIRHLLVLMGTAFVITGLLSAAAYLAKSPLPPIVTTKDGSVNISTAVTTTKETGPDAH